MKSMDIETEKDYGIEAYHAGYTAGYENGKRDAMKWISVKERLPDEDGEYLVVCGRMNSLLGLSVDFRHFAKDMSKCFSCNEEYASLPGWYFYDSECGDVEDNSVMYWMPKPALPKEIDTGM